MNKVLYCKYLIKIEITDVEKNAQLFSFSEIPRAIIDAPFRLFR